MTFVQRLQGNFAITDPNWPVYSAWIPGQVWTSDSFSGDGEIAGRQSDALLGGTPVRWLGTTGGWDVAGGQLTQLTPGANAYFETPHQDYELSVRIVEIPSEGSISLMARRTDITFTSQMEHVILNIAGGNAAGLVQMRSAEESGTLHSFWGNKAGGIFTLRVQGDTLTCLRNGDELMTHTTEHLPTGEVAGISVSGGGATPTLVLDDVSITAL